MPANSTLQCITADNSGGYNAYTYEYYGWDSMKWEFEPLTTGVGAAPEAELYDKVEDFGNGPDCFGYALNKDYECELYMIFEDSSETVIDFDAMVQQTINYVINEENRTIYLIDSYDSPIRENEYRICMRVGNHMLQNPDGTQYREFDYHFMRQTNDNKWANRHGTALMIEGRDILAGNPAEMDWFLPSCTFPYYDENGDIICQWSYENYFYDSNIVYFAVSLN